MTASRLIRRRIQRAATYKPGPLAVVGRGTHAAIRECGGGGRHKDRDKQTADRGSQEETGRAKHDGSEN